MYIMCTRTATVTNIGRLFDQALALPWTVDALDETLPVNSRNPARRSSYAIATAGSNVPPNDAQGLATAAQCAKQGLLHPKMAVGANDSICRALAYTFSSPRLRYLELPPTLSPAATLHCGNECYSSNAWAEAHHHRLRSRCSCSLLLHATDLIRSTTQYGFKTANTIRAA